MVLFTESPHNWIAVHPHMYPKPPRALFSLLRYLIYRCGGDSHLGEWVDGEILNIGMIRYAGPNRTYSWSMVISYKVIIPFI